jgi:hypothetical protein
MPPNSLRHWQKLASEKPCVQLSGRQARKRLAQEANDLFFGKSLLHVLSSVSWNWTPTSFATQIRGDVDPNL